MNLKRAFIFLALVPMLALSFFSCNRCKETGEIEFSSTNQYFSVTYIANDSAGTNLLTGGLANPNNVSVLLNTQGGKGPYSPLSEDISDGVFGPFDYTKTPQQAQFGVPYEYIYILQVDTFAVDTYEVVFVPNVDECKEYWQGLEFYRNDSLISSDEEILELTVTVD